MNQSSYFLIGFALFFLIVNSAWKRVLIVCSPYISMPFLYVGVKLGIPFLLSVYFLGRIFLNPGVDRRQACLTVTLFFGSLIGFFTNQLEVPWGELLKKNMALCSGFLFFLGVSRVSYWRALSKSRIEMAIGVIAVLALLQISLIGVFAIWGSVDGYGTAFIASQEILGIELPRANILGYEPKHLGMLCCFLQGMYFFRCIDSKRSPSALIIVLLLAIVMLTGSKSAFVSFLVILTFSFAFLIPRTRNLAISLAISIVAIVFLIYLESAGGLRMFSFVDIFLVDEVDEVAFGTDKDLPAILTLLDRPILALFGVGFGLSPHVFESSIGIDVEVITEPNFGLIAILYNFGLFGIVAILAFVHFSCTTLRKGEAFILMVPSLMLFDLYVFFMALSAIASLRR